MSKRKFDWKRSYDRYKENYRKIENNNSMADPMIKSVTEYKKYYKQYKYLYPGTKNIPRDIAMEQRVVTYQEARDISKRTGGEYSVREIKEWKSLEYEMFGQTYTAVSERQSLYLTLKFKYGEEEADEAFGYVD